MKIGILTFHAAHNYGAILQCYALQKYLSAQGHTVEVINYQNEKLISVYKPFCVNRFLRKNPISFVKLLSAELKYYQLRKERCYKFSCFLDNYIPLSHTDMLFKDYYDLILVGSDQVWNYKLTYGFDKFYWGQFDHSGKILASYAASMHDNWPKEYNSTIESYLQAFDYLSVRETSLLKKLQEIIPNKVIYQCVDPTLLLNAEDWKAFGKALNITKRYVLVYQVDPNPIAIKIAEKVSTERNLEILYLSARADGMNSKVIRSSSPQEFVELFMNAEFVVSSSFHGTIFSLMFNKPFYSVRNKGKEERIISLLKPAGLIDRFVDKVPNEIDYSMYSNSFDDMIAQSKKFLDIITFS